MLPQHYRLPATISFRNATVYTCPFFTAKIVPNNLEQNRFGFIIGKATAKQATTRNRARRLLRSCIEERLDIIKGNHDMLFLLKKGIIGAEREILLGEIDTFLTTKKLLKP